MTILWLGESLTYDSTLVGSKAANLNRFFRDYNIPPGFIIPANYFLAIHIEDQNSTNYIQFSKAYKQLSLLVDTETLGVAIRSSSSHEDGSLTSFAGQHDTFLNVKGEPTVLKAIIECSHSASTSRASEYKRILNIESDNSYISVIVQQMIPSEVSGIAFSSNPINKNNNEIFITTSWGLGESIADGIVTPDNYIVDKSDNSIKLSQINRKEIMIIPSENGTIESQVSPDIQKESSISENQIIEITDLIIKLENQMQKPVDVEFGYYKGILYLLQCRPITTI